MSFPSKCSQPSGRHWVSRTIRSVEDLVHTLSTLGFTGDEESPDASGGDRETSRSGVLGPAPSTYAPPDSVAPASREVALRGLVPGLSAIDRARDKRAWHEDNHQWIYRWGDAFVLSCDGVTEFKKHMLKSFAESWEMKEKMQAEMHEKPLERVMKEALNYDSTLYKQALGFEKS